MLSVLLAKFTFEAGSMKLLFLNGTIYMLSNGVSIRTDEYDIKGSYGKYYEGKGFVYLNDAKIKSTKLFLSSKYLFYDRKSSFLELKGNAFFEDNYRKISGNVIRSKRDSAWVMGDVLVVSKSRNITIKGDSAFYDGINSYGWVRKNAESIVPSAETLNIKAEMFIMHLDTTFGYGNVVITSKSVEARGDTFVAFIKNDTLRRVFLTGNVAVRWKNGKGYSKLSDMMFNRGALSAVILRDSAEVIYREGGGTITVSGDRIRADVINDTLKHIFVEGLKRGSYR